MQIGNNTNTGTSKLFTYTGDGSTTDFSIGYLISDYNSIDVYIDGLRQLHDSFTIVTSSTGYDLQFYVAPALDAVIVIKFPFVVGLPLSLGDGFDLFDMKQTDHTIDTGNGWELQGSLCNGALYTSAFDILVEQYTNGTETTETVGGVSITYYRGTKGYKIIHVDDKVAMYDAVFAATGTAQYYVLDEVNTQFYLPKTGWFFQATTDDSKVGDHNEAGLPNITGTISTSGAQSASSGCVTDATGAIALEAGNVGGVFQTFTINASLSNSIYGNSTTVQPKSNNVLIYYKVGGTIINAGFTDIKNATAALNNIYTNNKVAKTLYENSTTSDSNTISLSESYSIYNYAMSGAETITFNSTNINLSKSPTFELRIYMASVYAITWGSTISWVYGSTPAPASVGYHYFTFRYDTTLAKWLGVYGGFYS